MNGRPIMIVVAQTVSRKVPVTPKRSSSEAVSAMVDG
jgi:hypothetical protein